MGGDKLLLIPVVIGLALVVFLIVAAWKLFEKAGQPGWASIVPFYSYYIVLKIVGRPGWWLALMFIPLVNIVILIIVAIDFAKAFGKGGGTAVLLILLPFIGYPMLAFGDATYVGPVADPNFQAGAYGYPQAGYPQLMYLRPGQQSGYPQQGQPQQGWMRPVFPPQPGYPRQRDQPYPPQQQPPYPPR